MTSDSKNAVNWNDFGVYRNGEYGRDLPTNWLPVTSIDLGCGYEWEEFHAFWSPTARRYFWHGSAGCSCNSWADDVDAEADFRNGGRADLLRAIREWCVKAECSIDIYERAMSEVRAFREVSDD